MIKEDDIRDALDDTAKDISLLEANPRAWLSWIVYLLARLEEQTADANPAHREAFVEMLSALRDEIRNRVRTGGWH